MTIDDVLNRYFRNERIMYFQQSDAHKLIEGDTYLRYSMRGESVELWFGGDNGEVCLLVTPDAEVVEKMIKLIVYGQ